MAISKLRPGDETVLAIPTADVDGVPYLIGPDGLEDYSDPSAALLNFWIDASKQSSPGGTAGGNISCTILDDMNLGLTDSDTDDDRTICSKGQSDALTFYNFDAEFNILRDEDLDADGIFNHARAITRAPDVPYFIAQRVGIDSKEHTKIGEEWDFYYAYTDNPVPGYGDGENQSIGVNMVPKNQVNVGHVLTK